MGSSTWSGDAVRDVLLAIAMAEGGKKPCPKWEKVEAIMTDWGYGFSASAIQCVSRIAHLTLNTFFSHFSFSVAFISPLLCNSHSFTQLNKS